MNNEINTIAKRISARRKELNLTYQELANKTGMSKSTLQRYESGAIASVPLSKLDTLAKALNCEPEYIMGWDKNPTPNENVAIDSIYLSWAKKAQKNGIDPQDIEKALDLIKQLKK